MKRKYNAKSQERHPQEAGVPDSSPPRDMARWQVD
eukprot:CAMPEP_0206146070 /NCGR_PEP_ID=MMETSP1473-20131121/29372_1 /ASSEMBLY_ACC=CAM_ASM_001109 /TAXON_ID=1461547 /ORGANISM="Stichococcus sp, Strain RCC1054" /LENGTH=34 /DNA_ID= /DNA_START= /DNA_END= /DNA_ORIENTATION=